MTRLRLLLESLVFYWRTNLAVLLGVVAGTAVIGGALVVGDSVRGSLRQMTLDRLGRIDFALSSHRFFREELAQEIAGRETFSQQFARIAPAIAMQGAVERTVNAESEADPPRSPLVKGGRKQEAPLVKDGGKANEAQTARAGQVNIYGVDERLWPMIEQGGIAPPKEGEIVVNRRVADQLAAAGRPLRVGDAVTVWIEVPASIPRDLLLGGDAQNPQVSTELPLRVAAILDDRLGAARLDLKPTQQLPPVAYVALSPLQYALGLDEQRDRRTRAVTKPARVNTLFVQAKTEPAARELAAAQPAADALTQVLRHELRFDDLMLRLLPNEKLGYLALESRQQILPTALAAAARRAADKLIVPTSPVLVYLANELRTLDESQIDLTREHQHGYSMYSVVAGLDFPLPPPFGPFEFVGARPRFPLAADDILLNDWVAEDLGVGVGDTVAMTYHVVGSHGELPEETRRLTVAGIVKLDGTPAADRHLTPTVEGITDVETFNDWRQPFPMHIEYDPDHPQQHYVTLRDEQYWRDDRATPKAFMQLDVAQRLWRSRYGELTSFRLAPSEGETLPQLAGRFERAFFEELDPADAALAFLPIKAQGLQAATGTTPFAGLFIGFSFFLILSAMILIGLLFRLGIEWRAVQVGLLSAVGFGPGRVRRQLLGEGVLVVIVGGLLGVAAAVGYAAVMMYGLRTWWYGAVGTRALTLFVEPLSLVYGFLIAVLIAAAAVWWALRQLRRVSTRQLLAGTVQPALSAGEQRRRGRWARAVAIVGSAVAAVLIVAALVGLIPSAEAFMGIGWQAVAFFVIGIALLTASLAALAAWLDADHAAAVHGAGLLGTGRLGLRNAARSRTRSVATVGLIASATFVIVAVAAGHRNPAAERPRLHSGNGGFLLVAESSTPILADLNTPAGRDTLGLAGHAKLLDETRTVAFRVKPGEDASCLNLYQTRLPTILGVPWAMIDRGGFKFVGADRENPWTLLAGKVELENGVPVYPVFGDMNTLQYSLKKGVGDTIAVPDADHPEYKLKIVGMLDGSVFQGVLLLAEDNFRQLYPEQVGYRYFLIAAPPSDQMRLSNLLETELADYGFDAEPVAERLASFLAVQNTYLSTFQTLGGLGLLLGTFGLATVMLRNVLERRSELALLRAVGFGHGRLAWLVLCENAFLLAWGLLAGTVSALLAMVPHLTSTGADVPWLAGGIMLAAVFLIGMLAALLAVAEALRTPIIATLRAE